MAIRPYADKKPTLLLIGLSVASSSMCPPGGGGGRKWNFGLRLFVPALPVMAVMAACGLMKSPQDRRNRTPLFLVLGGLLFSIPCILTDLAAGYGITYNGMADSFRVDGYPLFSAFQFLQHIFATGPLDLNGIDILWVRQAGQTGGLTLLPMALTLALTAALGVKAIAALNNGKQLQRTAESRVKTLLQQRPLLLLPPEPTTGKDRMITARPQSERYCRTQQSHRVGERIDLRNLGVIVAGFAGVLLLIPPARIYPVTDDWIYSQSVNDLVQLANKPHD